MSALTIAIVGTGKIGSTFAYHLAKAGHDVTVVARQGSPRLAQLQRDGGIVLKTGERAAVSVVDQLDEQVAYDLVLVTMYDFQVDAVLPTLRRSKAKAIQFMFVTFDPERLRAAVGNERCSFGMPAVMARLDEEGRLSPTVSSRQKTLHGDRRWMELFIGAGIPSNFDPDMALWLRCHVPLTTAIGERLRGRSPKGQGRLMAGGHGHRARHARGLRHHQGIRRSSVPAFEARHRLSADLLDRLLATALVRHKVVSRVAGPRGQGSACACRLDVGSGS